MVVIKLIVTILGEKRRRGIWPRSEFDRNSPDSCPPYQAHSIDSALSTAMI